MNADQIKTLINLASENEEEYIMSNSYSGRGMFGKECLSITINSRYDMTRFEETLTDLGIYPGRTDSMGLGVVMYWPSTRINLDEDEELANVWEDYRERYKERTGYSIY